MDRSHYDVGIIGSGIAGAALATALTRQGLTVALLDRRPGLLDTARGDHIQPGVQPLLERWGVLESLMLAGAEKRFGTRWLDGEGNHIVTIPVPDHPECPPYFLFLNHEQIGEVLLSRATQAGARSVTNVSHWSIERGNGQWTVYWKQAEDTGEFDCTLLVGADGTASSVRRTLKMDIERHRYQYPIAVLYGQLRDVPERRTLDVFVTADRIVSMIPRTGGESKLGLPIESEELPFWRDQPEDVLRSRLAQWCPQLEFEHVSFGDIYPPVSQQSKAYTGQGAAVLIGDARHAMHPARSMGMNTCFRVAGQLAECLKILSSGFSESEVLPVLSTFEASFSRTLAPQIAENHAAGLQMDTLSGGGFPQLLAQLRAAAESPKVLQSLALRAAGVES